MKALLVEAVVEVSSHEGVRAHTQVCSIPSFSCSIVCSCVAYCSHASVTSDPSLDTSQPVVRQLTPLHSKMWPNF